MNPKSLLWPTGVAVVVAALALLLAHGPVASSTMRMGGSPTTDSKVQSGHAQVQISMFEFAPTAITVKAGTRVTFTNHDSTAHTATANSGAWDTGTINPNSSKTIVLNQPGVYPYHCAFHAFMTGSVTVVQ